VGTRASLDHACRKLPADGNSRGHDLSGSLRRRKRSSNATIVVVFCDGGEKYLSERFWDETGEGTR
jgi:cysteine synthase